MKQMSLGSNLFEMLPRRTRKRQFLEEMDTAVPWSRLIKLIEPHDVFIMRPCMLCRFLRSKPVVSACTVILLAGIHAPSFGQVYKCETAGGATAYQGTPCRVSEKSAVIQAEAVRPENKLRAFLAKVPYGISPEDVLRRLPGSKPDLRSTTTGRRPSVVEIDSFKIAGTEFFVRFEFQSDELVQVNLQETNNMKENASTGLAFDAIVGEFRKTYGQETTRRLETKPSGLYGGAEWRVNGSRVDVAIVPMSQNHSTLLINFFSK